MSRLADPSAAYVGVLLAGGSLGESALVRVGQEALGR